MRGPRVIRRPVGWLWPMGTLVEKTSGARWRGRVVGYYQTSLTDKGYAVESYYECGSVQIYPAKALRRWEPPEGEEERRLG